MKSLIRKNNGLLEEKSSKYWLLSSGENKAVDKDLAENEDFIQIVQTFFVKLGHYGQIS